jgi:alkane 1-monooxygenase
MGMDTAMCQTPPTWTDPKRYAWLLGLAVPLLPFMAWGLVAATGWGAFWFWGPAFVFGIMPLLDTAIGKDSANPPDSVVKHLEEDR